MKRPEISNLRLKVVLAALAAAAIVVGLFLPVPHRTGAHSLFATVEVGHG
jgi:hypothetical protein